MSDSIVVRDARPDDAQAIADLFLAVYGTGYLYPEFYQAHEVMRMIFDENTLVLVAEEPASGRLVGSGGVLFQMGAYTDLVGEFGRLVVDPNWRGRGIGHQIMAARLERLRGRLHVGFVEVRVHDGHSPRISEAHDFVPVGLLPQKLIFGTEREHAGLLVQYFGDALGLRRNHPRVIPEAAALADGTLRRIGLEPDIVIDDGAAPYPRVDGWTVQELTEEGYSSLLRIERGRVRHRMIFGPQRLSYGLFKLSASHSNYLVVRDQGRVVGALGYMIEPIERHVRVFELIHAADDVIVYLFEALEARCREERQMCIEVDVDAHAPRMQRTLLGMGYLPCAYIPAMAFHEVERLDVVKMYRLLEPLIDLPLVGPEGTVEVGKQVLDRFAELEVMPRIARAMRQIDLCASLTPEQSRQLLGEFGARSVQPGDRLFKEGDEPEEMILVIEGRARIDMNGESVGRVGPGECLGEVSFLNRAPHSASAVAETFMEIGYLERGRLAALVRRRPDIGTVVYRNLARGLGGKLLRADRDRPPDRVDSPER